MCGMAGAMRAMEKLAELEEERIKGLEDRLQGQEKIEYESLKEEITRKNKKTWRKARVVGVAGILTIASSLYLTAKGYSETGKKIDEQKTIQEHHEDKDSFQAYVDSRSPFLDYAWLGIIVGNAICAAGCIAGQSIMSKREKPLRDYLDSHTTRE